MSFNVRVVGFIDHMKIAEAIDTAKRMADAAEKGVMYLTKGLSYNFTFKKDEITGVTIKQAPNIIDLDRVDTPEDDGRTLRTLAEIEEIIDLTPIEEAEFLMEATLDEFDPDEFDLSETKEFARLIAKVLHRRDNGTDSVEDLKVGQTVIVKDLDSELFSSILEYVDSGEVGVILNISLQSDDFWIVAFPEGIVKKETRYGANKVAIHKDLLELHQ